MSVAKTLEIIIITIIMMVIPTRGKADSKAFSIAKWSPILKV